jgi:micrococcal nuclease
MYEYKAIMRRVIDGDTIVVDIDLGFAIWRHEERLRLADINAPEIKGAERPAGLKAKAALEQLLYPGRELFIRTEKDKSDSFGRWIAHVYTDTNYVNDWLILEGHATYKEY